MQRRKFSRSLLPPKSIQLTSPSANVSLTLPKMVQPVMQSSTLQHRKITRARMENYLPSSLTSTVDLPRHRDLDYHGLLSGGLREVSALSPLTVSDFSRSFSFPSHTSLTQDGAFHRWRIDRTWVRVQKTIDGNLGSRRRPRFNLLR